ncbi:MAG TPA: cupin domain-containing protein [Rubrobacteraceae bacterium]|nr:cupin domain-containing protein [Rubrobacteraceae bacterium]
MNVVSAADMEEVRRGPEEWFTGAVWMDAAPTSPPDAGVFRVLFEPGARTNWHTHPEGQILYVVTGSGRAQKEGEPVIEIHTGDVLYIAPGEKHWHGAGPETFMVHMAVNPATNSSGGADWMEPVTDEEYAGEAG